LEQFGNLFKHTVKLLSFIDGKYARLPFNFETVQQLIGAKKAENVIRKLREAYIGRDRVPVLELLNNTDTEIKDYATLLFEKAYKIYCAKQWNVPIDKIEKTVMDRVPMAMNYDERYMNKDFQYLPKDGFHKFFEKILDHKNIHTSLNVDALDYLNLNDKDKTVYYDGKQVDCLVFTGPIDELFRLKYGILSYRSLKFIYEYYEKDSILPAEIVSYPQADGYTRKTEYKKLMLEYLNIRGSIVATEYPIQYARESGKNTNNIPYYPVLTKETNAGAGGIFVKPKIIKVFFFVVGLLNLSTIIWMTAFSMPLKSLGK
jgi:UDP-galactopyranose mutase